MWFSDKSMYLFTTLPRARYVAHLVILIKKTLNVDVTNITSKSGSYCRIVHKIYQKYIIISRDAGKT